MWVMTYLISSQVFQSWKISPVDYAFAVLFYFLNFQMHVILKRSLCWGNTCAWFMCNGWKGCLLLSMFQRDRCQVLMDAQASGHSGAPPICSSLTGAGPGMRPFHDCLAFLSINAHVLTLSVLKHLASEVIPALCCHMCEDKILKEELLDVCVHW